MSDFENAKDDLVGKAKEGFGEATGNDDVKNEGKADQVKSEVKDKVEEAGEAIKDKANEVFGKFKD